MLIDFEFTNIKKRQRYFLSDVGMANYVMKKANLLVSESSGLLNETFVYHCLLDKISTVPMFGIYGDGELDFVYRDRESGYVYGIEVGHIQEITDQYACIFGVIRRRQVSLIAQHYERNLSSRLTQNIQRIFGLLFSFMCLKAGKNPGKTITKSLANGKINFAVYLKGVTQGGIVNKTYTIPIFLFPRFEFSKI